jgi:hypothetical protein
MVLLRLQWRRQTSNNVTSSKGKWGGGATTGGEGNGNGLLLLLSAAFCFNKTEMLKSGAKTCACRLCHEKKALGGEVIFSTAFGAKCSVTNAFSSSSSANNCSQECGQS